MPRTNIKNNINKIIAIINIIKNINPKNIRNKIARGNAINKINIKYNLNLKSILFNFAITKAINM